MKVSFENRCEGQGWDRMRTAVRTLNSSEVMYLKSVASSFMLGPLGKRWK